MAIALDLPKDHALRSTIEQYKKRFEEYSDEYLFSKFKNHLTQKLMVHKFLFFGDNSQKQLSRSCSAPCT